MERDKKFRPEFEREIYKRRFSTNKRPVCSKFRSTLFWDTSFEHIDFVARKRYVINRVFKRGTEEEILETIRFYGKDTILETITFVATSLLPRISNKT